MKNNFSPITVFAFAIVVLAIAGCGVVDSGNAQKSGEKMKKLGLALLNLESALNQLPMDRETKEGVPGLSWRVTALNDPNLGQNNLYDQFHLDEPWDSEHNLTLVEKMPDCYRRPGMTLDKGKTVYKLAYGNGALVKEESPAQTVRIPDGSSKTIMLVEMDATNASVWTKPNDYYQFNPQAPFAGLEVQSSGNVNVVMANGAVKQFNKNDTAIEKMRAAFTTSGND